MARRLTRYFIGGEGKTELLGVTLNERNADPARLLRAMRDGDRGTAGVSLFPRP